jgi:hypothetical protein
MMVEDLMPLFGGIGLGYLLGMACMAYIIGDPMEEAAAALARKDQLFEEAAEQLSIVRAENERLAELQRKFEQAFIDYDHTLNAEFFRNNRNT